MDQRYNLIKTRFSELTNDQLNRIVNNVNLLCLDTWNYDKVNKTYCPLAIALNIHNTISEPTQELVEMEISKYFKPVNVLKGVPGKFYTRNRLDDILSLISDIKLDRFRQNIKSIKMLRKFSYSGYLINNLDSNINFSEYLD